MTDAQKVDVAQINRFLSAIHPTPGRVFVLTYLDKVEAEKAEDKNGKKIKHNKSVQSAAFAYDGMAGSDVLTAIRLENCDARHKAAALSLGTFPQGGRLAANCASMAAFGIDLDQKNLDRIVPCATDPLAVVAEVVQRLTARGIPPHLLVHSGNGLHVYLLLEEVVFKNDEERSRFSSIWYQLGQLLGGSTDRHDLASVLRVPGTWNRKHGKNVLARFIDGYTDPTLPRYSLEAVALAVADQPDKNLLKEKPYDTKAGTTGTTAQANGSICAAEQHLLRVAFAGNPRLCEQKIAGMFKGKKNDRSEADYAYACDLISLGFKESTILSELLDSHKGQEKGKSYAERTFQAAFENTADQNNMVKTCGYVVESSMNSLVYSIGRATNEHSVFVGPPTAPALLVYAGPAGSGKSYAVRDVLGSHNGLRKGQVVVSMAQASELLLMEHAINNSFPYGMGWQEEQANMYRFDPALPRSGEELITGMPEREGSKGFLPRSNAKLLNVKNPEAYYINAISPVDWDTRLEAGEDEDGNMIPPSGYLDWDKVMKPFAVAKCSGNVELCLAELSVSELKKNACKRCSFTACRANTSKGGSKTYSSKDVPVRLMTHSALRIQSAFAPEKNDCEILVVDELPQFVCRNAGFSIAPSSRGGARKIWTCDLLETIEHAMAGQIEGRSAVASILAPISKQIADFTAIARKLRREVIKGTRTPHERKIDSMTPLLTVAQWRELVAFLKKVGVDPEEGNNLSEALLVLRDFASDGPKIEVYCEHTFEKTGVGKLRVFRPVNGWPDLLESESRRLNVILDATATLDPRYQLLGTAGQVESQLSYPATTVLCTAESTVSKTAYEKRDPSEVVQTIVSELKPHLEKLARGMGPGDSQSRPSWLKLLVVTSKDSEDALRTAIKQQTEKGTLPEQTVVDHFGNLRGKNDYADFDAVYFTHCYRYSGDAYIGLGLLLNKFNGPRQWTSVNSVHWRYDDIVNAWMAADLYQDALRIGIRRDPARRALICIATSSPGLLLPLVERLPGAEVVFPSGALIPGLAGPASLTLAALPATNLGLPLNSQDDAAILAQFGVAS